jgi:dodecin
MADSEEDTGLYRVTEIIGTSAISWEDATRNAIHVASQSVRDLRIAEIIKLDVKIDGGEIVTYRVRIALSFKYETKKHGGSV